MNDLKDGLDEEFLLWIRTASFFKELRIQETTGFPPLKLKTEQSNEKKETVFRGLRPY